MKERLEGPLADLIAAERDEMEAMPRSRDVAWAGIAAAWPPPPPPPPPAGVAEAAAASSGKAGVLKIVAAVVVGTSVAAGAWVASSQEQSGAPARVEAPVVVARAEAPPEPAIEPEPERIVEPEPSPTPEPERIVQPETVAEPNPRPAAKPEPAPAKAGLAEELALIDAMRKDVAAGRHAAALRRAKQHRATFEQGSLTADRMDLEAAARCGGGNLEAGRKLVDRKRSRWPRAPLSERLRTLCRLDER